MASLLRFVRSSFQRSLRAPLVPLQFPTTGFPVVENDTILEEEQYKEFHDGQYCPVNIGDVYASKYQVLGKLGFGTTSTVWLARHLEQHGYVALKVFTKDTNTNEIDVYKQLSKASPSHPGYSYIRTALDTFKIQHGTDDYQCLVHKPMWDSWKDLLRWNPERRFSTELIKAGLCQLLLALDCLHTECHLVHTDIKADNIMLKLVDQDVLDAFTTEELETPSARKQVNGTTVYASRRFDYPSEVGGSVLCDFGEAVAGNVKRNHDAQPNVYRSPEVMLMTEWSYPVDIWNVGTMIWDLYEGHHLFYGYDTEKKKYMTRAHLAEVVGMLGPPPLDLLSRGQRSKEFFTDDGDWKADVDIPLGTSLASSVTRLEGKEKEMFLSFVRGMLQWRPEDRKTAAQLLEDPWLQSCL